MLSRWRASSMPCSRTSAHMQSGVGIKVSSRSPAVLHHCLRFLQPILKRHFLHDQHAKIVRKFCISCTGKSAADITPIRRGIGDGTKDSFTFTLYHNFTCECLQTLPLRLQYSLTRTPGILNWLHRGFVPQMIKQSVLDQVFTALVRNKQRAVTTIQRC